MSSALNPVIVAFAFLSFMSCASDPLDVGTEAFNNVDRRLWDYFARFEEEGRLRGVAVDLNQVGITGEIANIPGSGVAGQCQFGSHISNHVTIDNAYWSRAGDLDREFVVFHELGHCFLFRGHLEDSFSNGLCVSIMRSGLGNCMDGYSPQNRSYYLDELFSGTE